jgi:hypothetical protein
LPFNHPTDVAVAPSGEIYVCDGHGNAHVLCFSADGRHRRSWGGIGTGPGQFSTPRGIWVTDDGHILVADARTTASSSLPATAPISASGATSTTRWTFTATRMGRFSSPTRHRASSPSRLRARFSASVRPWDLQSRHLGRRRRQPFPVRAHRHAHQAGAIAVAQTCRGAKPIASERSAPP